MRIGQGWDLHRLEKGRPLIIGGVTVPFEKGLEPLARAAGGLLGLRLSLLFFLEHGFFSSFCRK